MPIGRCFQHPWGLIQNLACKKRAATSLLPQTLLGTPLRAGVQLEGRPVEGLPEDGVGIRRMKQ